MGKLRHREVNRCARIPQPLKGPSVSGAKSMHSAFLHSVSERRLGLDGPMPAPQTAQGTRVWVRVPPQFHFITLGIAHENCQVLHPRPTPALFSFAPHHHHISVEMLRGGYSLRRTRAKSRAAVDREDCCFKRGLWETVPFLASAMSIGP